MRLLVVIVNFRCADLVIDCLRSIENQIAPHSDRRVQIIDNHSGDDSVPKLTTALAANGWATWAQLLPLNRNGGFAFGNNAAIQSVLTSPDRPQFVLLLNPDTIAQAKAIDALLEFMQANPKIGIAGSRLEDPDGTPQRSAFRFHSIAGELERGVRLGWVSRMLARRTIAPPPPKVAQRCDWVAGASMMIRTAVFDRIGLMDERYFMYFEEVDFCQSARRAGWSCWYVPQSRVIHLVGAVSQISDSRRHRQRRPAYWFESRRRYFVKNYGWLYATLADLAFLSGLSLWRMRRFVQGKDDTDPPRLLSDSFAHSVFLRGWAV
jgi:N-acetylglucosaminyl-diphospho-decaprenol L-rhamnosyltransferase